MHCLHSVRLQGFPENQARFCTGHKFLFSSSQTSGGETGSNPVSVNAQTFPRDERKNYNVSRQQRLCLNELAMTLLTGNDLPEWPRELVRTQFISVEILRELSRYLDMEGEENHGTYGKKTERYGKRNRLKASRAISFSYLSVFFPYVPWFSSLVLELPLVSHLAQFEAHIELDSVAELRPEA